MRTSVVRTRRVLDGSVTESNEQTVLQLRAERPELTDEEVMNLAETYRCNWTAIADSIGGTDGWSLRNRYQSLLELRLRGQPVRAESAGSSVSWATGEDSDHSGEHFLPSLDLHLSGTEVTAQDLGEALLQDLSGAETEFGLGTAGGRRRRRLVGRLQPADFDADVGRI